MRRSRAEYTGIAVQSDRPATRRLQSGDGAQRGGLAAAGRAEQRHQFAGRDVEADAVHRDDVAVAHDKIGDLDARAIHWVTPVTRRATLNMMATAMNTMAVWISAMAADSSELEVSHELTIAGAITLEFGPIRKIETPSSRTEAMKISSHAATRPGRSSGMVTVRI